MLFTGPSALPVPSPPGHLATYLIELWNLKVRSGSLKLSCLTSHSRRIPLCINPGEEYTVLVTSSNGELSTTQGTYASTKWAVH